MIIEDKASFKDDVSDKSKGKDKDVAETKIESPAWIVSRYVEIEYVPPTRNNTLYR